jgi:hypothetical protein
VKVHDTSLEKLKEKVRAASDEFESAIAFHEAWKPTAYDRALHE